MSGFQQHETEPGKKKQDKTNEQTNKTLRFFFTVALSLLPYEIQFQILKVVVTGYVNVQPDF